MEILWLIRFYCSRYNLKQTNGAIPNFCTLKISPRLKKTSESPLSIRSEYFFPDCSLPIIYFAFALKSVSKRFSACQSTANNNWGQIEFMSVRIKVKTTFRSWKKYFKHAWNSFFTPLMQQNPLSCHVHDVSLKKQSFKKRADLNLQRRLKQM